MPPTLPLTIEFDVKLNGRLLDPTIKEAIEEIRIDENLHLPAMLMIRLHVNNMDWLGSTTFAEGQPIEVAASQHGTRKPLFKGKLSSVEPDLSIEMPLLILRAYDLSYKLHRLRERRAYLNVTDGDLARQLATAGGLRPEVDDPGVTHEYVFQNNVSHFEFLRERAWLNGYDFFCEDDKLCFKRPHTPRGETTTLAYGQNLKRFRPRSTTFEPVREVTVRGWDPKTKREIVGRATSPNGQPTIGQSKPGHAVAADAWGDARYTITHLTLDSASAADKLAQSYLDELNGSHIEAEGLCDGMAGIRLLRRVTIEGVGARFGGTYVVTGVSHTFTSRGHQTAFTVSARRAGTVHELLNGSRPRPETFGPVIGIVTNINDPDKGGRIKVKFPWLADTAESHWARLATPLTGNGRGAHFLPEINDEVLVAFEHGDINRPYIIGGLWNGKDKPPAPPALPGGRNEEILKGTGAVKSRLIKSTKGNMLIFNDSDNAPGVFLVGSSGAYIMVDDEQGKEKIALTDKTRRDRIEIRSQDKSIHIECEGDIVIETKANLKATVQGNAEITVQGNLQAKVTGSAQVESTGAMTLKSSSSVTVEATGPLTLKGATVSVEGQAATTVKGATVNVQGSGPVAITGAVVKLN
jgi:phage protein D